MPETTRPASRPAAGFARTGFWAALVVALVPALKAAVPVLVPIPDEALVGLLLGAVTAAGKIARSAGGWLGRLGRFF